MTTPSAQEIQAELTKGRSALEEAEILLREGKLDGATSRGYYAIFHAARAVVWTKGYAPKTHKGVVQQFGQHVVKSGEVEVTFSDILKDAADDRELADYHALAGEFERAEVERLVRDGRRFVEKMEELVSRLAA